MASWPQPVPPVHHAPDVPLRPAAEGPLPPAHPVRLRSASARPSPLVDAEVIDVLWRLYSSGSGSGTWQYASARIDDPEPRRAYVERLKDYYRPHLAKLSEDSQRRFDRNPLRLLDCKDERDQPYQGRGAEAHRPAEPGSGRAPRTVVQRRSKPRESRTHRPAAGARPRLLQPHGLRDRADRRRARAGHGRRRRPLRRADRDPWAARRRRRMGFGQRHRTRSSSRWKRSERARSRKRRGAEVFIVHQRKARRRAAVRAGRANCVERRYRGHRRRDRTVVQVADARRELATAREFAAHPRRTTNWRRAPAC